MARKPARFAVELRNLKAVKIRVHEIAKAVATEAGVSSLLKGTYREIVAAYGKSAELIRNKARAYAQSAGAPRRLFTGARPAIFAFSDFDSSRDDKRKRSSMVGVRTGLSYRTPDSRLFIKWGRGATRKKDGSIAAGGLSMSFGALFERGTKNKRVKPRRYFRNAIFSSRGAVISLLTNAYKAAAARINALKNT